MVLKNSKESNSKNRPEVLNWAVQLGALAVIYILVWAGKFPTEVRDYARRVEGGKCASCGSEENGQIHHVCYEGIAKKYKIGRKFYNHPANSRLLCESCHIKIHAQDPLDSPLAELEMLRELFERIIDFHTSHKEGGARWVNKGKKLAILDNPGQILREATQELAKIKAEIERLT